jgi:hypothetical protein
MKTGPGGSSRGKGSKANKDKTKSGRNQPNTGGKKEHRGGRSPQRSGCSASGRRSGRTGNKPEGAKPASAKTGATSQQRSRMDPPQGERRPRRGWNGKPLGDRSVRKYHKGEAPAEEWTTPGIETIRELIGSLDLGDIPGLATPPVLIPQPEFVLPSECIIWPELITQADVMLSPELELRPELTVPPELILPPSTIVLPGLKSSSLVPPVSFTPEFDSFLLEVLGNPNRGGVFNVCTDSWQIVLLSFHLRPLFYSLLEVMIDYVHGVGPAAGRGRNTKVSTERLRLEIKARYAKPFSRVYRLVHDFRNFMSDDVGPVIQQRLGILVGTKLGDDVVPKGKSREGYRLALRPGQIRYRRIPD